MDVFDLLAKLTLDTSEYEEGLSGAHEKAGSFGGKIGQALGTAGKVGAAAVTAVTTATVAMGTAVVKSSGETAAYGDNIDKMSQKMGMSAEAYQEWDAIMQHSGTSIESMQAGMKTLANAVENGNDAFERLGISQEEIANMSQEELFGATISALQNVENETERTYLAGQLLGRGATELGALLNTSAEETEAMRQRVHELGGVMSDEAVKAAAHYQDSLQDMQTAFQGLQRNLTSEFLPGITGVMDGLAEVFMGNNDEGLGMISTGIDNLIGNLTEQLPRFMDVGLGIVDALAEAILQNIPKLAESAVHIITGLTTNIVKKLPDIMSAGVEILFALIDGITESLPELIPAVVEVIVTIVEKLTEPDTLMKLIEAAFKILGALAEGLIKAIPELLKSAPVIIKNLVEAIINLVPEMVKGGEELVKGIGRGIIGMVDEAVDAVKSLLGKIKDAIFGVVDRARQWGADMIENFTGGIKSKVSGVVSAVSGIASRVKSFLGFSEPEEGPLSNFSTYAPDMMKLFAQGIKDNEHLVTDQIRSSFDFGNLTTAAAPAVAGGVGSTTNTYNITVNGIEELEELLRWFESRQVRARMA